MGRPIFRLTFPDGSSEENSDAEYLKALRDTRGVGGDIELFDITWRIQNDPSPTIYQTSEEADSRLAELSNMYFIEPIKTYVSPQPAGLNP